MAELPERKVLKETLVNLKAKTLRSDSVVLQSFKTLLSDLDRIRQKSYELYESQKVPIPHGPAELLNNYIIMIQNWVLGLVNTYFSAHEDASTYVKLLESYSTELDKTLYDAIEAGKKKAEDQTEEQNKLTSGSKDSYVA